MDKSKPSQAGAPRSACELPQPLQLRLRVLLVRLAPHVRELGGCAARWAQRWRVPTALPSLAASAQHLAARVAVGGSAVEAPRDALLQQALHDLEEQVAQVELLATQDARAWHLWLQAWATADHLHGPRAGEEGVRLLAHDLLAPLAVLDAAIELGEATGSTARGRRMRELVRQRRQRLRAVLEGERLSLLVAWSDALELQPVLQGVLADVEPELRALGVVVDQRAHRRGLDGRWWGHAGVLEELMRALFDLLLLDEARLVGRRLCVTLGAPSRGPALRLLLAGPGCPSVEAWLAVLPRRVQQRGQQLWELVSRAARAHGGGAHWRMRWCTMIEVCLLPSDPAAGVEVNVEAATRA